MHDDPSVSLRAFIPSQKLNGFGIFGTIVAFWRKKGRKGMILTLEEYAREKYGLMETLVKEVLADAKKTRTERAARERQIARDLDRARMRRIVQGLNFICFINFINFIDLEDVPQRQ